MPRSRPGVGEGKVIWIQSVRGRGDRAVCCVGYIRNMEAECFADEGFNRRAVAEIRRRVIKNGQRNIVSRLVYKKDDKNEMAGWILALRNLGRAFIVCSVGHTWRSLSVSL